MNTIKLVVDFAEIFVISMSFVVGYSFLLLSGYLCRHKSVLRMERLFINFSSTYGQQILYLCDLIFVECRQRFIN